MVTYLRYYPRGSKHRFVLSDEQFDEMVRVMGFEQAVEKDNACIKLVPESDEEALDMFNESCQRVIDNPRYYLDNIDRIPTFQIKYKVLYKQIDENRDNYMKKYIKNETYLN